MEIVLSFARPVLLGSSGQSASKTQRETISIQHLVRFLFKTCWELRLVFTVMRWAEDWRWNVRRVEIWDTVKNADTTSHPELTIVVSANVVSSAWYSIYKLSCFSHFFMLGMVHGLQKTHRISDRRIWLSNSCEFFCVWMIFRFLLLTAVSELAVVLGVWENLIRLVTGYAAGPSLLVDKQLCGS